MFLALFGDVYVIVFSPLFSLQVESVTVIVTTVSTTLVNQEGIEVVRRLVDVFVRQSNFIVQFLHLLPIRSHSFFQCLLIVTQQGKHILRDMWSKFGQVSWFQQLVFNIHLAILLLKESLSIGQ